ncbi:MAG TPA: hypothetical protein PLU15_10985 [Bacillota bacterium]|jgi:hypothetical protein|nr:hypothetical protein [Bacillota bacterium]
MDRRAWPTFATTQTRFSVSANYTIEKVARKLTGFICNEHYLQEFKNLPSKPPVETAVSGYFSVSGFPEEWQIV